MIPSPDHETLTLINSLRLCMRVRYIGDAKLRCGGTITQINHWLDDTDRKRCDVRVLWDDGDISVYSDDFLYQMLRSKQLEVASENHI